MKKLHSVLIIPLALPLSYCAKSSKQRASEIFNEGYALSLQATNKYATADTTESASINRRAIVKFRETLELNPNHPMARAAIGHSYYLLDNFPQAIKWFEASNEEMRNEPSAVLVANYRELGISRIGTNDIEGGCADLQKAFRLDSLSNPKNTLEIKKITADDLHSLGRQAFHYGDGYNSLGQTKKGQSFHEAGVNMLLTAYSIDTTRLDIAESIAERAAKLGNKKLSLKYAKRAQQ